MSFLERRFRPVMAALCLVYLGIQAAYIETLPLVMDEFQGAYSVRQLADGLPYRDFIPYKTVAGYYLQLAVMQLTAETWSQLMLVKASIAVMTAAGVFWCGCLLARQYRRAAVCLGTVLLFCVSTFLERSAELRVDMMTSLAGLASLALLLNRHFAAAGLLAGASFLLSQKGLYFLLAGALSCSSSWWLGKPNRAQVTEGLHFVGGGMAPIAGYVLLWGAASSFSTVIHTVFLKHADIALDDLYQIKRYWFDTLEANPYFYAAGAIALGISFARRDQPENGFRDRALFVYGAAVLAFGFWHKQPWPYFFVLIIPTVYVLAVAFLDSELARPRKLSKVFWLLFLVLGVVAPLRRVNAVMARDSGFQENTVRLAEALLAPEDEYLAGTQMLSRNQQPEAEHLGWLDMRHLHRVQLMDPQRVVQWLQQSRLKLVIMNGRLRALPPVVREYLDANYRWFHGAIHLYAPSITSAEFQLKFSGMYVLHADQPVVLDGQVVAPGGRLRLLAGSHAASAAPFRLWLEPEVPAELLDPRYQQLEPLFDRPYDY